MTAPNAAREQQTALIGYTGFVGGNLLRQRSFDATFNSANIDGIAGRSFDLVVCCGARAEKWKANAEPEQDYDNIERLIRPLGQANIRRLALVSTVDVFLSPIDVDEDSPTPLTGLHAYGRNRRRLEQIVAGRFDATIVRLPGLYGPGLKKNAIHDLLRNHDTHKIDSRGVFQFYNVERLWKDIASAMECGIPLAHLPTEPVSVAEVARTSLGIEFTNETASTPARYDVHTRFADAFGASAADRYIEDKATELSGIGAFASAERESHG